MSDRVALGCLNVTLVWIHGSRGNRGKGVLPVFFPPRTRQLGKCCTTSLLQHEEWPWALSIAIRPHLHADLTTENGTALEFAVEARVVVGSRHGFVVRVAWSTVLAGQTLR